MEINQFEDMCRSVKFGVVDLEYFLVSNVFVAAWANKDDCKETLQTFRKQRAALSILSNAVVYLHSSSSCCRDEALLQLLCFSVSL